MFEVTPMIWKNDLIHPVKRRRGGNGGYTCRPMVSSVNVRSSSSVHQCFTMSCTLYLPQEDLQEASNYKQDYSRA